MDTKRFGPGANEDDFLIAISGAFVPPLRCEYSLPFADAPLISTHYKNQTLRLEVFRQSQ